MKKFLAYIFSFAMCLTVLAGCNLIELNKAKYYNQVVVSIEYKDDTATKKFTMYDLLQAYNNYGYQFMENNQSADPKEALNKTAELMVQRYMLVNKIKAEVELTDIEKNALKRETYKYMNQSLASLESEIRVEWDRVNKEPETSDDKKEPLRAAYTPYEPTIERVYDENGMNPKLERVIDDEEIDETPAGDFVQNITDEDVSTEAMKRYKKQLKENAENLGQKVKDSELLNTEMSRIYGILEENKYISKFQTKLTNNLEIKEQAVVDSYKKKFLRDYEQYNNDLTAYHTAMGTDSSTVYYHPETANAAYVNVTHILFGYSEEQKAEIASLKSQLASNDIEQKVYDTKMAEVTSLERTTVKYEVDGEVKTISATQAFEDIKSGVLRFNAENNFENRAKAFNDYIYKYNDDPGIVNKDFSYVVNLDTSVQDKMVKEFADEARALYKKGLGEMSVAPVKTEHGYHVILNLGAVKNVVKYESINNLNWQVLYNTKTQPSSEKTLFHFEYDALKLDENAVNTSVDNMIADLTAEAKVINYYKDRYLSLLETK